MTKEKTPFVVTIDVVFQTYATDETQAWKIAKNLETIVSDKLPKESLFYDDIRAGDVYPNPQT